MLMNVRTRSLGYHFYYTANNKKSSDKEPTCDSPKVTQKTAKLDCSVHLKIYTSITQASKRY